MRIVHVTDSSIFNYDGISTYVNELLKCAQAQGDPCLVLMPPPLDPHRQRKVGHSSRTGVFPSVKLLSSDKFVFSWPKGMAGMLADFNPDVVWIHTIGPLGLAAARLARGKCRILYTKHCFDGELWCRHLRIPNGFQWLFHLVAQAVENRVLGFVDGAYYHFKQSVKIHSRFFFHKFKYIPPQLNARFLIEKSHRRVDPRYKTLTVGYCGRLDPEKGLETIFAAGEHYRRSYPEAKLQWVLIGDGSVGRELRERYRDLDVTITGFVDDVIPYLDQLDAFVLASTTETTSLASLEAYARGLPLFSTRVGFIGSHPENFRHVYNFETPTELAALLHEILEIRKVSVPAVPVAEDDSFITFARFHAMVGSHEEFGPMPPRPSAVEWPRHSTHGRKPPARV